MTPRKLDDYQRGLGRPALRLVPMPPDHDRAAAWRGLWWVAVLALGAAVWAWRLWR